MGRWLSRYCRYAASRSEASRTPKKSGRRLISTRDDTKRRGPTQDSWFALLLRYLVEKPSLVLGEAGDSFLADLVEHPVHLCRDWVGVRPATRPHRRDRRPPLGLGRAGLHHDHSLDGTGRWGRVSPGQQLRPEEQIAKQ